MKYFFTGILVFLQWNAAFALDCGFNNTREPSDILEHIEAIHEMPAPDDVLCFNELKSFLIEAAKPSSNVSESPQQTIRSAYENPRQENLQRIQHLMALAAKNQEDIEQATPRLHPEIPLQNRIPIKITRARITQTSFIASKALLSETASDLEKQIGKFQMQTQGPMLWNPYLPWIPPQRDGFLNQMAHTPLQNKEEQTEEGFPLDKEEELTLQSLEGLQYIWTENIHIEFPSIILCQKPQDEFSQAFFNNFKDYEKKLTDFTSSNIEIEDIYINIMEWMDSLKNQEGQDLSTPHPLFNFTSYTNQFNQIPGFILDIMTDEQKEKLDYIRDLSKKYSWMYHLHFEYRKCLPKIFREHLLISYSAPAPINIEDSAASKPPTEKLFDIELLYEFSAYTPPFASSFKQSYPIRIFRQSYTDWDDFTLNELTNRYEPEWNETLQFLKQFILQNRTYLDVSF